MATNNIQRNEMIRQAVLRRPDPNQDVTILLWERLATELISIIGEGGFQSLYARSIHLVSATYPWMTPDRPWQQNESRFFSLKTSLEGRDPTEASEASIALLITFIDILAMLIGELLTTSILQTAWGNDAMNAAAKELK